MEQARPARLEGAWMRIVANGCPTELPVAQLYQPLETSSQGKFYSCPQPALISQIFHSGAQNPANASSEPAFPSNPGAAEGLIKGDRKARVRAVTQAKGKPWEAARGRRSFKQSASCVWGDASQGEPSHVFWDSTGILSAQNDFSGISYPQVI